MPHIDIKGKRFGRYTVIRFVGNDKHGCALWECKCDCGTVKNVLGISLRKGDIVSCGCYHKEEVAKRKTTHGLSKARIRNIWNHIKQRCTNPHDTAFKYYGGKGITICDEWLNDFMSFYEWSMANGYTDELTIDRIDTNKGYNPSNCRWVSRMVQQNNRNAAHLFTVNGKTGSIAELCRIYNQNHETVRNRVLKKGWDIETALTTPPLKRNGKPLYSDA